MSPFLLRLFIAAIVSGFGGLAFSRFFGITAWAFIWLPVAALLGVWAALSGAFE